MKVTQGQLKRWVAPYPKESKLVMVMETKYGYGWVKVVEVATGKQTSAQIRNLEETWKRR
tara:strand:- start:974 stop:1153 length:180 start_codon:yes stop_codon:yes gene_type:complete